MVQLKREYMAVKAENLPITGESVCVIENGLKGNDLREYANFLAKRTDRVLVLSENGQGLTNYVLIDADGQAKTFGQEIQKTFEGKGGGKPQMIQGTLKGDYLTIKEWFENHK